MQLSLCIFVATAVTLGLTKPVVKRGPPSPKAVEGNSPEDPNDTGLAYNSYLKQVVEVLESDPDFRQKLETANVSEIKSGQIAIHLEMVNHTIRSVLDEIKRREVNRLQELARLQMQSMSGTDLIMNALQGARERGVRKFEIPGHLDVKNPHSFEMKDLEALIKKTTSDLEEMDKKRKEEFKEYEMEKKFEQEEHLRQMSEEEKKKEMARLEELKKKHAQHPKVNHPGSKDQFEEVWDKVDHLEDQEFNPRTFFFTHDLNGDLEWSVEEVDAVLQLELDKVYDARNSPDEDDPLEREEEMARMRKHVFKEMDKDNNWRISYDEFINYTGTQGDNKEFEKDDGWKTVDEEPVFTDEDYQRYLAEYHAQPGVINNPPNNDLHFQAQEEMMRQQQQGQFQQQQFQQPPQQQFQQHQQQQLNQQQLNQFAQQQQQQHGVDQQQLQKQLAELQERMMKQEQQLNQQQPNVNQQQQQPNANQQQQQQPNVNQQQQQLNVNQQQQQPNVNQQQQQPNVNQQQQQQQQQPNVNQQQQPNMVHQQQPNINVNQQQNQQQINQNSNQQQPQP